MKKIKITDPQYPKRLKEIANPPKFLYANGNCEVLNKTSLAIVGTRKPTKYGVKFATKFANELASQNICIISGLAEGIDSYAHNASKSEIGKTIAVLGSGINNIYPKQNQELAQEIIENGGCIISEYEPCEEAQMEYFPSRNRIISGISMGVLIIEARYRSGSSITARQAIKQNKPIFCIPRDINQKTGYTTNEFIKNGAELVTCSEDILQYYSYQKQDKNISEEFIDVYKILGEIPLSSDEICKLTDLSIQSINEKLMFMEIEGIAKKVAGGYIKV